MRYKSYYRSGGCIPQQTGSSRSTASVIPEEEEVITSDSVLSNDVRNLSKPADFGAFNDIEDQENDDEFSDSYSETDVDEEESDYFDVTEEETNALLFYGLKTAAAIENEAEAAETGYESFHSDEESIPASERQSEFSDDERESEEEITDADLPIYPGCILTPRQSECLLLGFCVRHLTTDAALSDLIDLIDCHLPVPIHGSKHLFLKNIDESKAEQVFYCEFCKNTLLETPNENKESHFKCGLQGCPEQGKLHSVPELVKKELFFLRMSLKQQLLHVLDNPELFSRLRRSADEGVLGGDKYRALRESGVIGPDDITIQFNTDGVNAFKSSRDSIWPLQVIINELPFRIRNQHVILAGLWFGIKPTINTFFEYFVEELIDLHNNGLTLAHNGKNIKVHCLLSSVDSVARPLLQGIKQFNGEFGCSYCLHPGENLKWSDEETGKNKKRKRNEEVEEEDGVKEKKNSRSRIYKGPPGEDRTEAQHMQDAEAAVAGGKAIRGVKNVSILLLLPIFHIIMSFVPDYMHNLLLGVTRQFFFGWMNPANSAQKWYLSTEKQEILNRRLLSMSPPDEITRLPRDIKNRKKFKASEFRTFLLHYSAPALRDLLPSEYYRHWLLLVYAVRIFLQKKISDTEWQSATEAMEKFVRMTEELYPKQWLTFNVHLLLHVPRFVKWFGGLWDSSCFIFEHYNGVLVKLFHGTRHVAKQIYKNYLRLQHLQKTIDEKKVFSNCHSAVAKLLQKLCGNYLLPDNPPDVSKKIKTLGSCKLTKLDLSEIIALRSFLPMQLFATNEEFKSWERFVVNGIKCSVTNYSRAKRRNHLVQLTNGDYFEIDKVILIENDFVLIGKKLIVDVENLYRGVPGLQKKSFMPCTLKNDFMQRQVMAIKADSVAKKCVYMLLEDGAEYVSVLPNNYERD